jgi:excisionase family DNA binding protein
MSDKPEYYKVSAVAKRLDVGVMTVYRMIERDEIPGAINFGPRVFRIHAETFDNWLAAKNMRGQQ